MKALFLAIQLGLGVLAAYQGMIIFNTYKPPAQEAAAPAGQQGPSVEAPAAKATAPAEKVKVKTSSRALEQAVVKRNLFKVLTDKPKAGPAPGPSTVKKELEKTQLKLALWGTVAGLREEECWAVIEDQAKRNQALYKIGDQVQGAKIKAISRNRVILTHNGKDQVLEAQTTRRKTASPKNLPKNALARSRPVAPTRIPIKGEVKAPGELIRTMKTRPYLKNGKPSGLLVYGVRPNSDIMALGLKNGDIIHTIDGVEIASPQDLNTVASDLGDAPDLRISLLRRGQSREVVFDGQSQAFTTQSLKD